MLQRELSYLNHTSEGSNTDNFFGIDLNKPIRQASGLIGGLIEAWLDQNGYNQSNIYSGYTLQYGDRDNNGIYEGKTNQTRSNYVQTLQQDLEDVGIRIRNRRPDGVFDFETELAVREFQIYAKMPGVAVRAAGPSLVYGDNFVSAPNQVVYNGPINGVVNAKIRRRIQFWKNNGYKCPVIVQAWNIRNNTPNRIFRAHDNIWRFNEVTHDDPRMYVRDLSNYYTFPQGRNSNAVVIGDGAAGGPEVRGANHSWNETEFTTQDIFNGSTLSQLTGPQQSTFKIIRAIANAEANGGYLDRINGWDDQYISYGPYHWTLAVGEFPSFLAFLKDRQQTLGGNFYDKAIGFFGIDIKAVDSRRNEHDWNGTGQAFFMSGSQRKFAHGRMKVVSNNAGVVINDLADPAWGNYFRSWHWFYRFVMAVRTIPEFRTLTYDFARMRIRDVLSIPINNFGFIDANGNPVNPTIGDIFKSEKSFAMVLRIHVFRPAWIGDVINNRNNTLRRILRSAVNRIGNHNFSTWTAAEERILINEIRNHRYPSRNQDVHETLRGVNNFNYQNQVNGTLSEQRNFVFDNTNLPVIVY